MKLWEVFKALAENPTDEYEATGFKKRYVLSMSHTGFYYLDIYNEQGELIPKRLDGSQFNGNIKPDFEWEKVKKEVTWKEALEAWANGKAVRCILPTGGLMDYEGDHANILNREILTGKWYIL